MASDDDTLEVTAHDGSMDYIKWPGLLEHLLPRLNHIVYNQFPIPTIPLTKPPNSPSQRGSTIGEMPQFPKIDTPPDRVNRHAAPLQSSPPLPSPSAKSPSAQTFIPDSQPSEPPPPTENLPPQLESFYSNIKTSLKTTFSNAPPFTIQRLTELVLRPSAHYRTLPSYLRALDRVISVSSTANTFPLPLIATSDNDSNYLASSSSLVHSDDFNGAALTRIPWLRDPAPMTASSDRPLTTDLRTESKRLIDGPNGAGSIETVTVAVNGIPSASRSSLGARQEPSASNGLEEDELSEQASADNDSASRQEDEADEERVHARGPEEIGMEDMGPQQVDRDGHVFDAEAAIGRPGEAENFPPSETVAVKDGKDKEEDEDGQNGKQEQSSPIGDGEADADSSGP